MVALVSFRHQQNVLNVDPQLKEQKVVLRFAVPEPTRVSLRIYDATGRVVRRVFDGILGSGEWPFAWDGKNDAGDGVTSGVYFAVAEAREKLFRTKLVLVR